MPGLNVPFEGNELEAVTAAAHAAGVSARQYIRDAALSRALAKQTAFLDAALEAYAYSKGAFAEVCPEDAAMNAEFRRAEEEAARRLAEMDSQAHGTAA
jgi:hypothetical protein